MTVYRPATPRDASAILRFLEEMHSGLPWRVAPVNEFMAIKVIIVCIESGYCEVAINEETKKLVGVIGAILTSEWWSDRPGIRQGFLHTADQPGRAFVAARLIRGMMEKAKSLNVQVAMGDIAGGADVRRVRFYERLGLYPIGVNYIGGA